MDFAGTVIITWPRRKPGPAKVLAGWGTALSDPVTGEPITTVTAIEMHLHNTAQDLIWAELTMFAGEDGKPIYGGTPVLRAGEVIYGTFPFLVSEMRVAEA